MSDGVRTARRDAAPVPVAELVEAVDAAAHLAELERRFGIPRRLFDDFVVFRANAQRLSIVDRRLRLPPSPEPLSVGMSFLYFRMERPRLTTAAAVRFGAHATRNLAELDHDEALDFAYRREIVLRPASAATIDGDGYVLARHRGLILGLGRCRHEDRGAVLYGMVPRSWRAHLRGGS